MPLGQSKYDMVCEHVRKMTCARGAIVIVFGGECGNGMACQVPKEVLPVIPEVLRETARLIEEEREQEARAARGN